MELSRYAELFLSESRAHLSSINHHLLELERSGDQGAVEEIFRAAHTLKGMSAAMGCQAAADVAHALEHLLDRLRQGERQLDEAALEALFDAADVLEEAIPRELAGEPSPGTVAPLLARLELLAGIGAGGAEAAGGIEPVSAPEDGVRVTVMIQASAALPAVRAMLVLRGVRELGEVSGVEPPEEQLLTGHFSGTLRFELRTERDVAAIREVVQRAGEVARVVVEGGGVAERTEPPEAPRGARAADAYVRINQQRLDTLVERIGELVVTRDRLRQLVGEEAEGPLGEATEQMSRLIGEVRDEVMGMRMVPIGDAFDRFPRFVRDAARAMQKRVALEVSGRDTPLDRSLHNDLSDLLIHLLRNALDHGIEPPPEREAAGKPEVGRLRLSAERDRAQAVVRVEDDGRGIDRGRVVDAAVRNGVLTRADAGSLSDIEVLHLLTRPGFSTAEEVTEVSGRGVGLDVVATRVRALGGVLEIDSAVGEGTTFTLRLPLSLAIVRTLQLEAAGATYVIPISGIEEVTELGAGRNGSPEHFAFREERLPLVSLAAVLEPGETGRSDALAPVVVTRSAGGFYALAVDRLLGQHEAVLKPFDAPARMTDVFAGATILADGRPALVLDPMKLGKWAGRSGERQGGQTSPDPS